jgi:putative flippase GtrA
MAVAAPKTLSAAKSRAKAATSTQVGKFGLVGVLNTTIDYSLFILITHAFSIPLTEVWIAKLISGSAAIINSFYFNKTWVFKNTGGKDLKIQIFRFVSSTLVGVFVIQLSLTQFFSSIYPNLGVISFNIANSLGIVAIAPSHITQAFMIKTVAFGLATLASLTWNFILYKKWAFKA